MISFTITTGVPAAIGPIHSSATFRTSAFTASAVRWRPVASFTVTTRPSSTLGSSLSPLGLRRIPTASPPARATSKKRGTSTSTSTKSVVSPAATHSGDCSRSRNQRCRGPKITTSIAAKSSGSRKPDITRSDSSPKTATKPRITPSETKRVMRFFPASRALCASFMASPSGRRQYGEHCWINPSQVYAKATVAPPAVALRQPQLSLYESMVAIRLE